MFIASAIAAAYLLVLTGAYYLGVGDFRRHHVESGSFIFAAVFLASIFTRRGHGLPAEQSGEGQARWRWPAFVVLGFALYAPVIGAGLFADDFVLLEAAREGRWTVWTEFLRPMIFLVWRSLDAFPGDPDPLLHVFNIGLHAVNASMVAALGYRLGLPKWPAVAAGALFLVFPASVEAVAWPAGIQDVLMTSFVLGFLLMLMTPYLSAARALVGVGLAVAASLTKETGVVAPVLGLVACGAMRASPKRWVVALIAAAAVTSALAVRFAFVPLGSAVPQLSRYDLKELLVRPFATLAVPLRVSDVTALPWLPVALVTAVIVSLVVSGFRWNRGSEEFHRVLFGAAFVLLSVAPVGTAFFINEDLLGSRYLYLPAAGWAILLATILPSPHRGPTGVLRAMPTILIVACWFAVASTHIQRWSRAAELRDLILDAAAEAVPAGCREAIALGLPESAAGVPLFVNGFPEAMRSRLPPVRFNTADASTGSECRLSWNGTGFISP